MLTRRRFAIGSASAAGAVALGGLAAGRALAIPKSPASTAVGAMFGKFLKTIRGYPDASTFALLERVALSPATTPQMVEIAWELLGSYAAAGSNRPIPIPPGKPLAFPADHGQHNDTEFEWYYIALSLQLTNGALVSIIANFFRKAIGSSESAPSIAGFSRQIFSTSIGVTIQNMPGRSDAHYAIPTTTFFPESGGVTVGNEPFTLTLGKNSFIGTDSVFPLQVHLADAGSEAEGRPPIEVSVACAATNALFLQGNQGYVGVGEGGTGYYYYSWPQQQTTGTVKIGAVTHDANGIAWLDHQWGSDPTPARGSLPNTWLGWSWFEFQFDGNRSLTVGFAHGALRDGKLPVTPVVGAGTYVAQGISTYLYATMTVPPEAYVRSPNTTAWYPTQWDIKTVSGPSIHVVPNAALEPQTLWMGSLAEYSEASCTVKGTFTDGSLMQGVGFCESVSFEDPAEYKARAVAFLNAQLG